jgi:hypothetical protein
MIVLGVADTDHLMAREPELAQRDLEPRRLVDTRRQHHDGTAVADHLRLESELPHQILDGSSMRLARGDDHLPDLERQDAAGLQSLDQELRRRLARRVSSRLVGS